MTADKVPILQSTLQKHLKDIRLGKGKYLDVWFKMKAGFNVDLESFLGNAHNILQVKMNGCLLHKDLPYAYTEETHMIANSYPGMNVKDHKHKIQEIIQKAMDKKGRGQVCPPCAMKEKPLVNGTPYDEWKKLP
jgi:hypothetical protein